MGTTLAVIGAIAAVIAFVVVIKMYQKQAADEAFYTSSRKGIGSPVFYKKDGKQAVAWTLSEKEFHVVTPFGVLKMDVVEVKNNTTAILSNDDYEAVVYLDQNYFSRSVSRKLNISRDAWRVRSVRRKNDIWLESPEPLSDEISSAIEEWFLAETTLAAIDDLENLLLFHFLYDGFQQELSYYESLEPVHDGTDQIVGWENPQAEATPETNFDDLMTQQPERVSHEPEQAASYEPPVHEPAPEPEPERYSSPEPEPPRSYDPGPSSYDSGSYDSGGGGGGGGGFDD